MTDIWLSELPPGTSWAVVGWYTSDYAHWAKRFADSLRVHGAPFALKCVSKAGGWERTTRLKPKILMDFMAEMRGRTLILSDVDALAAGDLSPLADINCDVALRLQAKRLRGRHMIVPRTGTMVLQPGGRTLALIEAWQQACDTAGYGDTDESCLGAAIAGVEGLRIVNLQHTGELGGLIQHDQGSRGKVKASHLKRLLAKAWPRSLF